MNAFLFATAIAIARLCRPEGAASAFLPPRTSSTRRCDDGCRNLRMSVPTGIDTLTSGLASVVRVGTSGLAGVTVSSGAKATEDISLKLFDVENSSACRVVRELVTELDLVVDKVVPAAPNSRSVLDASFENSMPRGAEVPCLVATLPDGEEKVISGEAAVTRFLTETFSDPPEAADDSESLGQLVRAMSPAGLFVAGALRAGRGSAVTPAVTSSDKVNRPRESLVLYSYEGNQFCRLVREVLTELDIVYELRSAGKGSPRRSELAEITGGSTQCPYLVDPNTGTSMAESADIIRYLYRTYALWSPPNELLGWASQSVVPLFGPLFSFLAPLQAGSGSQGEGDSFESKIREATGQIEKETSADPVVLYTYDLSPFSSETKALLDGLQIRYREIPLGKEWIPGLLPPEGAIKRAALLQMTGQSSLPHVFVGGKPIGGLFSGAPGILPLLEEDKFLKMVEDAASARIVE